MRLIKCLNGKNLKLNKVLDVLNLKLSVDDKLEVTQITKFATDRRHDFKNYKMLVTSNFSFSVNVFKKLLPSKS